ncbi:MAG: iron-containing alcohol dehydrogenase [Dehalococcoidia bacterium]|nr:iron-containing alcohol dehydrogenase [Dehalococcoidia bacterium]
MEANVFSFMCKTKVVHGPGSVALVGEEAARLGVHRALLVTDRGILKAGLLQMVWESLAAHNVAWEVFDQVEEDAEVETMHLGALRARETGCDGVIVVGGGSPICAGKGIALEATNGKKVREFEGRNQYRVPPLPVVCISTTAGSGSDVSAAFVVHDAAQERVYAVGGDHVQPPVSILDPLLLRTCPPLQMVLSGLDALTHAVEALWTKKGTPLTDAIAYEAIRLIAGNLKRAAFTDDLESKNYQLLASTMANMACGNASLGLVHGMTMYYRLKLPHGYQNGVLLPYVMEFNLPACEENLARMAVVLGEPSGGKSPRQLARDALRHLKELYLDLGFPQKFDQNEFLAQEIPQMVETALGNGFIQDNIRKSTEKDLTALYEASLRGWDLD